MKKFFSSDKGKRVLVGLGLILVAIALGFALQGSLLASGVHWKQAIFFFLVTGTGVSGILFIFLGRRGLMIGYGAFFYISLLIALLSFSIGLVGALIVLPSVVGPALFKYLLSRNKLVGKQSKTPGHKSLQQVQMEQESWAVMQTVNAQPLVCMKSNSGIYQVFCKDGCLLFYRVGSLYRIGSLLHDFDAQNLKQEENLPPLEKDDFKIVLKDITTLRFHDVYSETDPFDLAISIYTWEKQYYFTASLANGGLKLESFLRSSIPSSAQQERRTKPHFIPSLNRHRREIMRKLYFGVCAFATVIDLAWLFFDVPYRLFAWLALLPTPLLLMMHYIFPNEVTLESEKAFAHNRVMIFYALIMSIAPLILRAIIDFHLLKYGKIFLITGILVILLLLQAYLTSEECRIHKVQLLGLTLLLVLYCFSAVSITNALLDRVPPQEKAAIVQNKDIAHGKGGESFFLDVQIASGEAYSFRVTESQYDKTEIGDSVKALFYQGAYVIPYAEIELIP